MSKYQTFSIRLPVEDLDALEQLANSEPRVQVNEKRTFPCTRSHLIQRAVKLYILKETPSESHD